MKALTRFSQKAKMHVIVLASQKGGAGKTTLAAHIAVAAEAAGDGPAVLIDADPQGSLSAWWNVRDTDSPALAPTTIADLPSTLTALAKAGYAVCGRRYAAGHHRGDWRRTALGRLCRYPHTAQPSRSTRRR